MKNTNPLFTQNPWKNNKNRIWLTSTLSLYRNIDKMYFPDKLDSEKQLQIFNLVSQSLLKNPSIKNPILFKGETISSTEKEYLAEHFLIPPTFQQADKGQGFLVNQTGEFITLLNIKDHIHWIIQGFSPDLEKDLTKLLEIEQALEEHLSYSFSEQFGYLTSHPKHCGTGFKIKCFLQVPALIHTDQLQPLVKSEEMIKVDSFTSSKEDWIGDLAVISNRYTLGTTEENSLSQVKNFVINLNQKEEEVRKSLKKEENPALKDKISRAYGILAHSYQIEAKEAMSALSMLKLGEDLGLIKGISQEKLNELFFIQRKSHLTKFYKTEMTPEKLLHKRAEFFTSSHQTC